MRPHVCLGFAAIAGFALSGYADRCALPREMRAAAENLNFAQGAPGAPLPGWYLGPEWFMPQHVPVYEARIAARDSCNGSPQCAVVRSLRNDRSVPLAFLYQIIDATPYRDKKVMLRAAVRADVAGAGEARLLVRVHRDDCRTSFREDMGNRPITASTWAVYEIQAPIGPDARDIEFGVQLIGQGAAWIDHLSLNLVDSPK